MEQPGFHPFPAPTEKATGLPRGMITELVLKRVFAEGTVTLSGLVRQTKLHFDVVSAVFRSLQKEQLCEVKGLVGHDYEFALTTQGMRLAEEAYRRNQYCGPAPVSLDDYCSAVCQQAFRPRVTRESLARHLSDLVVNDELIRGLGTALMSGGAIFLYGPTGNGKTSIAERLHRIFHDLVYIPYAVEISGHILNVYDGIIHQGAPEQPEGIDHRWVLCQRPSLKVGGELRPEMLEPHLDEVTRIGLAPLQMLANNGLLVIDDFGRQRIPARELLNRWIVPLDRRTDYFTLWSGVRFAVPFEITVVFATNLELSTLAEDAFMRRIKNKIKVDTITPEIFVRILRSICQEHRLACSPEMEAYLVQRCSQESPQGLRACYPRDLVDIVRGVAAFDQRAASLERADIETALKVYFGR